jgi:hypothetical protein
VDACGAARISLTISSVVAIAFSGGFETRMQDSGSSIMRPASRRVKQDFETKGLAVG